MQHMCSTYITYTITVHDYAYSKQTYRGVDASYANESYGNIDEHTEYVPQE
jgi:hypothetical protein